MIRLSLSLFLLCAASSSRAETPPEYASVKTKRGNVREEPKDDAKMKWRMFKWFVVEIVRYRGDWRLIRDFEGDEGWVHKSALTQEVPTVQVKGDSANLRKYPNGPIEWVLDHGYALRVFARKGDWLEVSDLEDANGWVSVSAVWGMTDAPPPPVE